VARGFPDDPVGPLSLPVALWGMWLRHVHRARTSPGNPNQGKDSQQGSGQVRRCTPLEVPPESPLGVVLPYAVMSSLRNSPLPKGKLGKVLYITVQCSAVQYVPVSLCTPNVLGRRQVLGVNLYSASSSASPVRGLRRGDAAHQKPVGCTSPDSSH